jgi:hypothetical protein
MTMTYSHLDPAMQSRVAWIAGKTVGTKRPPTQKQIRAIRFFLDREERLRDRAQFDLAIDSKLRGCDLVKLKIGDLAAGTDIRSRALVIQQKTGRPVQFEITAHARGSLAAEARQSRPTAFGIAVQPRACPGLGGKLNVGYGSTVVQSVTDEASWIIESFSSTMSA